MTDVAANTFTTLPAVPPSAPRKRVFLISGIVVGVALVLLVLALVISLVCYYPTLRKLMHPSTAREDCDNYKLLDTASSENKL